MSPEAYARALQHQEAAARDYEAAAMIYGSPFRSVRARYSGSATFGKWSTPGPVFAYIVEKQEPREG